MCHPTRLVIMAVFYASSGGPNYAERDLPTTDFLGERPELTLRAEWKKVMLNGGEREGDCWRAHIRLFKEGCQGKQREGES